VSREWSANVVSRPDAEKGGIEVALRAVVLPVPMNVGAHVSISGSRVSSDTETPEYDDVRNAVDTTRFVPDPDAKLSKAAQRQIANAERPLLGFVGGITDYKGVFDLAEAVRRADTAPTVVVAGDGPARRQFEEALGEQGLFLGSVDYEQMPAVYAAIDALVLPSHTEGLPRVLLEAGAAGRPSIATSVGGVPELIRDGETGLLCPPQQPSALAATIDYLFTDRDPVVMGRRARESITDAYTWDVQYDRYESFLTDITSKYGGRTTRDI